MANFLKIYGTLIIAAIALIQPWIFALWKRYFRQGKIEIYQTGNIEIGYSAFGPTIGLNGTLRCLHRNLFIKDIKLELIKHKDSSKHIFEWGVFRSEKITYAGEQQSSLEIPYGFMISPHFPHRFNIQFHDFVIKSEMQDIINKVRNEWYKLITNLYNEKLIQTFSQNAPSPPEVQELLKDHYEKFAKSEVHVEAYTNLDRMRYWEADEYSLKMIVRTSKPDRLFTKNWAFNLNEQEVKAIRLNVVKLLQDTCGRPSYGQYFFAYPKYE